jgi:hypothetical protein
VAPTYPAVPIPLDRKTEAVDSIGVVLDIAGNCDIVLLAERYYLKSGIAKRLRLSRLCLSVANHLSSFFILVNLTRHCCLSLFYKAFFTAKVEYKWYFGRHCIAKYNYSDDKILITRKQHLVS